MLVAFGSFSMINWWLIVSIKDRQHRSRHRSVNSSCGTKAKGVETMHSLTAESDSLNVAMLKPWLPQWFASPFSVHEHKPGGSPTRGSRWSARGGNRVVVGERWWRRCWSRLGGEAWWWGQHVAPLERGGTMRGPPGPWLRAGSCRSRSRWTWTQDS